MCYKENCSKRIWKPKKYSWTFFTCVFEDFFLFVICEKLRTLDYVLLRQIRLWKHADWSCSLLFQGNSSFVTSLFEYFQHWINPFEETDSFFLDSTVFFTIIYHGLRFAIWEIRIADEKGHIPQEQISIFLHKVTVSQYYKRTLQNSLCLATFLSCLEDIQYPSTSK